MCRFLAYIGKPVLADDLLYRPVHSIIDRQSLGAQEMSIPINGDGFGISWYDFNLDGRTNLHDLRRYVIDGKFPRKCPQ